MEEQVGSWGILELMRVKHSSACRIGGLRGCVLGAQCGKRNGEGEGGQESLCWGRIESGCCAPVCAGRTQRWELCKRGCMQKGLPCAPPAPEHCVSRAWSLSSRPQREARPCSVTSGSPWMMWRVQREAVTRCSGGFIWRPVHGFYWTCLESPTIKPARTWGHEDVDGREVEAEERAGAQ